MGTAASRTPVVLNLSRARAHRATTPDGLVLVDVQGELAPRDVHSWSQLLKSAITEGATGIAIDLRACRAVDFGCLTVMAAASVHLRSSGRRGISLVTTPRWPADQVALATFAEELPSCSTAAEALHSLRGVQ